MSDLLNQASLVLIPSGYKEDVVYSEIPTDGSGDMTFTRASDGTRINSAGLVENCPWNLLQYSEDFSNAAWQSQDSTISSNSTTAPNGTTTADTLIEGTTNFEHNRFQEPTINSGQFTYSIYLKKFNADWCALYVFNTIYGGVRYWVNVNTLTAGTSANIGSGLGTTSLSLESVGNGWVRASITFNNPSGACRFYVANAQSNGGSSSYLGNGTSGVYIWGAQVNIGSTAKPYFPTTNRQNVPRLTYQNGGGGCPSLLLEKQSTNLVTYSEAFDNSPWTLGTGGGTASASVTANYGISPDGTQNADRIQLNKGNTGYAEIYQLFSTTGGATYTQTMWLKSLSGTPKINFGFTGSTRGTITLTTEWQRYEFTYVTGGNPNAVALTLYNGFDSSTAQSIDVLAWGAQAEQSSYPTSYIPTQGSSVTRLADACYKTGISSLIGQTSGSVFFDFTVDSVTQTGDPVLWYMKDGGAGERYIELYANSNLTYAEIDGSGPIAIITKTGLTVGRHKCAIAYATNDFVFYVDGVQIGTDTSGTPNGFSTFGLQYYLSGYTGQQKVNQAILFPTRLTNAQLASLTTL